MKKILIALDYDPTAEKVAETGYSLAKAMNAEVVLLHVIADLSYYSSMTFSPIMGFTGFIDPNIPSDFMQTTHELEKGSRRFLGQIKKHLGDDAITTLVMDGDFAETILRAAKENNADIIVMGTHSRSGFDKFLMGSVAEKVFHHRTIPLFIIPNKGK